MEMTLYNPLRRLTPSRSLFSSFLGDDFFGWPELSIDAYHWHTVDHWHPVVDFLDTEDMIRLSAEIPGMEKKDIKIEVKDHTLSISGERKFEVDAKKERYRSVERTYGKFFRSIDLPEGLKEDEIKAGYRNGVLEISIPKSEAAMPREIPVEVQ